jgi:lysine decarboxylase
VTTGTGKEMRQAEAPLFDALEAYAARGIYPLHTPGHKNGRFADESLFSLVGSRGLALDLPSMQATDSTFHPAGCIRDAQALAAELVGARESFFLTAGSTLGVAAALMSCVPPGSTVAVPRNIHRAVVNGLVLADAHPRFLSHDVLHECGALGVTVGALEDALDEEPRPAAVLLTAPSYYGLSRDLSEHAALCRSRGVPLVVDEAHGGHFHFLPAGSPRPALESGADLVVQSWHKTLGSLVGSAMLHVGHGSLVEPQRVRHALNVLQTTSPSYLLLASLDLARRLMARDGERLFARAVEQARELEDEIARVPGLRVFRPSDDPRVEGHVRDPLRLVVDVSGTGWTGYDVELHLRNEVRVEDEMCDWTNVVYLLSPRDDRDAIRRLVSGLRSVSEQPRQPTRRYSAEELAQMMQPPIPTLAMPPRAAALGPKRSVALQDSVGRVSAEVVCFYPPGVPLLMPGEIVTQQVVDICERLRDAGAAPQANDPLLSTVWVVA